MCLGRFLLGLLPDALLWSTCCCVAWSASFLLRFCLVHLLAFARSPWTFMLETIRSSKRDDAGRCCGIVSSVNASGYLFSCYENLFSSWPWLNTSGSFATLINHKGSISKLSVANFDPRGEYQDVLAAVRAATDTEPTIFRVAIDMTRAFYYVVGLQGTKCVGMRALAVES